MNYQYGDIHEFALTENQINNNILVTGVTGFLGSNYIFWRSRFPGKIYVLVRAKDTHAAWLRTIDALESCARSYNLPLADRTELENKIVCITGDITKENCDICDVDIAKLTKANITEIWHCAASLSFEERHRDRIVKTNVTGTKSLMAMGKQFGIQRFIYISTAYTAGQLSGDIPEQIHEHNPNFSNCYEESKDMAEKTVAKFCNDNNMNWVILRPSIVIGPHITQCSGGTRFGIYGFAKEIFLLRDTLKNVQSRLRLIGEEDSQLNLIPVDQVVFDMLYIESINFGEQNVYHLSNSNNILLNDYFKVLEKNMGTDCLRLINKRDSKPSSLEKLFDRKTAFYAGYYKTKKNFLRSLPSHKAVNLQEVNNYMHNYREELINEEQGSVFNRHYVNSWDDEKLCTHTLGDNTKPALVIVNAFGMPIDFITPLAKRLANDYQIITWDSRWVPSLTHRFDLEKCDSLTHAKDLIAILDHFNIDKCFITGWSSGVQVCLRTMSEFADRIKCAILLNGGISLKLSEGSQITEYEENIRSLLPKIGKNKRMAKLYCDLIYGGTTQLKEKDEESMSTILTSTDPHLLYMTSMPFRTPEALYRYANMMSRMFAEQDDAYTSSIDTPVLVYGGLNDKITHPDVAKNLTSALKNAKLHISNDKDHFAQFYERSVAQMINKFCQQHNI
ncbi:MAG: alpha/beta fold hydrolase [Alcanivoracaceae bacterium]|nr:alpha/beta fold hydrolase [Alcanivoracaceae bacterium]